MKSLVCIAAALCLLLAGCSGTAPDGGTAAPQTTPQEGSAVPTGPYTTDTPIQTVMDDPVFGDYGRLLFPADTGYWSGDTLGSLRLTWYHNIDPEETVAIVNHLHTQAAAGETVFYDIYTPEEKAADPDKTDTGLFFFRGDPGGKVAFCNAGGGFAYVGAMQDSFPHALELSRRGYNAFALLYRPGARRPARTWPGPSPSSLTTPRNSRWTWRGTPSGAAPPGGGWRPGWGPMARRPSAGVTCPGPGR